jgi:predicted NBD/HSP70 family sugar kinase
VTGPFDSGIRIGLDVGGTKIAGIALADDGTVLGRVRRPSGWGDAAVLDGAVGSVIELIDQLDVSRERIRSIGIGIPGLVDAASGVVLHAVNLGVASLGLAAHVREALGVACVVENDVKAAALGAAALRRDTAPIAYLNLGTGVAAGVIIDGRIWRGARGTAGEVGHLVVDPQGRVCGCGQRGCIETLCGGGALALVLAADVETVVIGGGLTALAPRIEPGIRARLRRDAVPSPFLQSLHLDERIELLPADSAVAAIGAALLNAANAPTHPLEKEIPVHG